MSSPERTASNDSDASAAGISSVSIRLMGPTRSSTAAGATGADAVARTTRFAAGTGFAASGGRLASRERGAAIITVAISAKMETPATQRYEQRAGVAEEIT